MVQHDRFGLDDEIAGFRGCCSEYGVDRGDLFEGALQDFQPAIAKVVSYVRRGRLVGRTKRGITRRCAPLVRSWSPDPVFDAFWRG